VLRSILTVAAVAAGALYTSAQELNPLPGGNVTIVVPLAAGGPADSMARTIAEKISHRINRTVVVENLTPRLAATLGEAA
jgi:tripartite-type tricarboxylate transporter receptor subunit TctC